MRKRNTLSVRTSPNQSFYIVLRWLRLLDSETLQTLGASPYFQQSDSSKHKADKGTAAESRLKKPPCPAWIWESIVEAAYKLEREIQMFFFSLLSHCLHKDQPPATMFVLQNRNRE